jgi:hypothetical protein
MVDVSHKPSLRNDDPREECRNIRRMRVHISTPLRRMLQVKTSDFALLSSSARACTRGSWTSEYHSLVPLTHCRSAVAPPPALFREQVGKPKNYRPNLAARAARASVLAGLPVPLATADEACFGERYFLTALTSGTTSVPSALWWMAG